MEQGSSEWFNAKIGKVGASRINDIMAKLKSGGESASRRNYRAELVVARLTGVYPESYTSPAMQWGIDHEPEAKNLFNFLRGTTIENVGFIPHPDINNAGASPDGYVHSDALIEIKCPNTATHIDYLFKDKAPPEYINQMQFQMACTGRAMCFFMSYDPRMPFELSYFICEVKRDDERIKEIEKEVRIFLAEVDEVLLRLSEINHGRSKISA